MNQLDYSTGLRPRRIGWTLVRAFAIVVAAVVLLPAGCVVLWIVEDEVFITRMHHANLIGKTQAQIIAQLGPPDPFGTSTEPDGTVIICYRSLAGMGFRVDLRNGVAVGTMDLQH